MRKSMMAVVAMLAGVLTAGCGKTSEADFCKQVLDVGVGYESMCLGGPQDLWAAELAQTDQCAEITKSTAAGRTKYDADQADACIKEYKAVVCNPTTTADQIPSCALAVVGQVATGGACYNDGDCAGDAYCDGADAATCPSVCKAKTAIGGACNGGGCVKGASCSFSGSTGTCVAEPTTNLTYAHQGEDCSVNQCAQGLKCVTQSLVSSTTSTCQTMVKEGGACTGTDTSTCEFFTSCVNGKCTRGGSAGAACSSASGLECTVGFYCSDAGTCAAVKADGAACAGDTECHGGCSATSHTCVTAGCLEK